MKPSLANFIIQQELPIIQQLLSAGADVHEIDEYGFTPLIEAAIVNNTQITQLLLDHGANPNQNDLVGGTALHWAVENNNLELCELLLKNKADPNAHNLSAEPVLVKAILRENEPLKKLLYEHGAQTRFANDYIQIKLLGHRYDLRGEIDIVNSDGGFAELSLEGFFLESSTHILRQSLQQYIKNYEFRKNKQYNTVYKKIIRALWRAADLFKYQQYQININDHHGEIDRLLDHDLVILPVNYDGHAISFIHYKNYLVRCDRRPEERSINGIVIFEMQKPQMLTYHLMKFMMYEKKEPEFINTNLFKTLQLKVVARMMIEPQVTGNCAWANMAACVPASFFLLTDDPNHYSDSLIDYDHTALYQYRDWRNWDRKNAVDYCISNFTSADKNRKLMLGAALAALFFQRIHYQDPKMFELAKTIYKLLQEPGHQHHLKHYMDQYYYRKQTPAGVNLKRLMDACQHDF